MLIHMAVFEWNDGVTDEEVAGFSADIHAMARTLPQIRHYYCGPALGLRPGVGDFAIVAMVDDETALTEYLQHPIHTGAQDTWTSHMVKTRHSLQVSGTDWAAASTAG